MGCVFVIDDDDNTREFVATALKLGGFDVHDYRDLNSALAEFEQHKPMAAVVDLMMPGENIQEYVASMMKEGCSVIIYSGQISDSDHMELLKRGAMWVLYKPMSGPIIAEYVKKAERASIGMKVMRKLQPAGKELKERIQRSNDALASFTNRLKNESTAQAI